MEKADQQYGDNRGLGDSADSRGALGLGWAFNIVQN